MERISISVNHSLQPGRYVSDQPVQSLPPNSVAVLPHHSPFPDLSQFGLHIVPEFDFKVETVQAT